MKKQNASSSKLWRMVAVGIAAVVGVALIAFLLLNGKNIAVLNPQGVVAQTQKDLIVFTTLLSLVVVVPVFIMLFGFAWKYRESNTKAKHTPDADHNRVVEAIWWGVPIVIIGILSVVTWVTTHDLDPYKPLASDKHPVRVQVVALQWKWLFLYPEQGVASVNEVRFPEDTPVNFELTADAPMNGFWIPNLGTQVYAMNGMRSKLSLEADTPGTYRGSSTNISGKGYSDMTFNAIATSQEEFDIWVRNLQSSDKHLTQTTYDKLAEPSISSVDYYMLHDANIFKNVIAKYAHGGHGDTTESTHDHTGGYQ